MMKAESASPHAPPPSSLQFYRDLPAFEDFRGVTDLRHYVDLPDDWDIVISDVVGSTQAIAAGRYKDVNMVGAACIAAVANIDRSLDVPCLFGGDGSTIAVPRHLRDQVKDALAGSREMARHVFGLNLRVGIVPVSHLTSHGHQAKVAKYKMSEQIMQPAYFGDGWAVAEQLIRDPATAGEYLVAESWPADRANFRGLACRWNPVPSDRDGKLSLVVVSTDPRPERSAVYFAEVLSIIETVFDKIDALNPVKEILLKVSFRWNAFRVESLIQRLNRGLFARLGFLALAIPKHFLGMYFLSQKRNTRRIKWGQYQADFVKNSDYKKFDGSLRMIIDAWSAQTEALTAALEKLRMDGKIRYGMHMSREAIVTCLVHNLNGKHCHFVDGAEGGYALAAQQLKAQIKNG